MPIEGVSMKMRSMSEVVVALSFLWAGCGKSEPSSPPAKEAEVPPPSPAVAAKDLSAPSLPAPLDIAARFSASGWMGDAAAGKKYVNFVENDVANPHSPPHAMKVHYAIGPQGWAGIYWLNKPDNWGDQPGNDLSKAGYKRITFWARGEKGGEILEFKAGGVDAKKDGKPYADLFDVSSGKKTLTKDWQKYEIDLSDQKLSSVIGGFCWVANDSGNPGGLTFWLDDLQFEG
jgi:hypothetical protein